MWTSLLTRLSMGSQSSSTDLRGWQPALLSSHTPPMALPNIDLFKRIGWVADWGGAADGSAACADVSVRVRGQWHQGTSMTVLGHSNK